MFAARASRCKRASAAAITASSLSRGSDFGTQAWARPSPVMRFRVRCSPAPMCARGAPRRLHPLRATSPRYSLSVTSAVVSAGNQIGWRSNRRKVRIIRAASPQSLHVTLRAASTINCAAHGTSMTREKLVGGTHCCCSRTPHRVVRDLPETSGCVLIVQSGLRHRPPTPPRVSR